MFINKSVKRILVSGATLLMFTSVGASYSNVRVNARHLRTHQTFHRYTRKNLYLYHHKRYIHKYHVHKLTNRKDVHHYRAKKNVHHRNQHRIWVHRYNHRRHQHAIQSRKDYRHLRRYNKSRHGNGQLISISPNILNAIKSAKRQAATLNFPSEYFGNYFQKGYHNYDTFIHLAKHGSYALSDGLTSENYGLNFDPTGSTLVHTLQPEVSNGKINGTKDIYGAQFDNSLTPKFYKLSNHTIRIEPEDIDAYEDTGIGINYIKIQKLNSEQQGIRKFFKENNKKPYPEPPEN